MQDGDKKGKTVRQNKTRMQGNKARQGKAKQKGKAKQGKAKQKGKARQGKARQ